jgi:hypothetical protein
VGFYLVANQRRGTLWTGQVARFGVGTTFLYLLLVATLVAGGAWAILIPPALLLGAGLYLATFGSQSGVGMSARSLAILLTIVGASGIVLGLLRLAL